MVVDDWVVAEVLVQAVLECIHRWCINYFLRKFIPPVDDSLREEIVAIVGPCIRFPDFLAMASSPVGFRQWKKAGVYVISVTDILEDIYQITSQSSI